MAPNRAHLHTAHGLPDVLSVLNVVAGEQDPAICGYNLARNWRRLAEYFCAHPAKNAKRTYKDGNEDYPKFFHA